MPSTNAIPALRQPITHDHPTILTVAFPYAEIGSKAVGGAEVFCSQLEQAMGQLGFRSVVVAHADSQTSGRLYGTAVPPGPITDQVRAEVERIHQDNLDRAFAENDIALVHMHGFDFHRYALPGNVPILVTLHLPPSWYPDVIWNLAPNYHLLCVSESQRSTCPAAVQDRLHIIPNGVDLPDPASIRDAGRYALMLARICPEKNLHVGLDAARLAGIPALLAGAIFPYAKHQQYFEEEIAPRLTSRDPAHQTSIPFLHTEVSARFLGRVSGNEKARLLSRAACLLLPSSAPETSSLVAMEALSYGVPVIATAVGAVPEIVEHGRTGFLIWPGEDAVQRMAAAIARVPELDRKLCRAAAEERFPWSRTQDAYAALFRKLATSAATLPSVSCSAAPTPVKDRIAARETILEHIISGEELYALSSEWRELWRSDSNATPFQHPAWLLPWWEQFGPEGKLHALTVRLKQGGDLVGFLPVYIYQEPSASDQQPSATIRKLLFVGAGTTDYLDGLWHAGADWIARQALNQTCATSGWDQQSLDQLRESSPLTRVASEAGLLLSSAEPTSALDLNKEPPAKIRNNIRRYRRLAQAKGRLECHVAISAQDALAAFDDLVRFHAERWPGRGEISVLHDPRVIAHHRASLPLLLQAGLLCMFCLTLDEQTLGVLYGLLDPPSVRERRLYLYLIGFSAHFACLSPGTLLLDEAVRFAADANCKKVDLLRGGEHYKHLWGATSEPTLAIRTRR